MKEKINALSIKKMKRGKGEKDTLGGLFVWDINPERTALVVIDMQNCFVDPQGALYSPGFKEQVPRINQIANTCRESAIPVIWVQFIVRADCTDLGNTLMITPEENLSSPMLNFEGTRGAELYPELEIHDEDLIVTKKRYSAFISGSSPLDRILRFLDKDTVIIVGGATNVCCGTSARDAMMLDYKVIVVSDANAPISLPFMKHLSPEKIHEAELVNLSTFFAMVCTTKELLGKIKNSSAADNY